MGTVSDAPLPSLSYSRSLLYPYSIIIHISSIRSPAPCVHHTASIQIVPCSVNILPARRHGSASVQIIPVAVDPLPANLHHTAGIHIVPAPVHILPVCGSHAASVQIVPRSVDLLPARCASCRPAQDSSNCRRPFSSLSSYIRRRQNSTMQLSISFSSFSDTRLRNTHTTSLWRSAARHRCRRSTRPHLHRCSTPSSQTTRRLWNYSLQWREHGRYRSPRGPILFEKL